MSYITKENLANPSNYGVKRDTKNINWIVIHYTANDGDTDESNANYFHNKYVGASAHYFVDSDSVTRSVPDNYVAYAVGKDYRSGSNGGKYYGKCTNANSISIELCDDKKNGTIYPSAKTIENALEFTRELMKKYNVPVDHVIRHYDVNGKKCPLYWVEDKLWKNDFWSKISQANPSPKPSKKTYSGDFPKLPPILKKSERGEQVRRLQKFLNWYGNYKLEVDGDFGTKTENAVKKFQKENKLTVDGIFGKNSLAVAKTIKK